VEGRVDDLLAEVDGGLSRYERMLVLFKNEAEVMEARRQLRLGDHAATRHRAERWQEVHSAPMGRFAPFIVGSSTSKISINFAAVPAKAP
jgi:hypothetical protein